MKKAVIFDLDGTLLNTLNTIDHFLNIALSEFNLKNTTPDMTRAFVGNGPKKLVERALGKEYSEPLFNKVFKLYDDLYNASPDHLTTAYDGVNELLLKLKSEGYLLGIISNKQEKIVKKTVSAIFGDKLFDEVMGQTEGVPVKPHPLAMERIINALGVNTKEVIYVGDSDVDIISGKNAHLFKTVGVSWGFRSRESLVLAGAEYLADNTDELYRIISE